MEHGYLRKLSPYMAARLKIRLESHSGPESLRKTHGACGKGGFFSMWVRAKGTLLNLREIGRGKNKSPAGLGPRGRTSRSIDKLKREQG